MATTTVKHPANSDSGDRNWTNSVLLPYGIAIAAQIPMLFLYFRDLWARPHYQFFPFAILATIYFAYDRWPRQHAMPFHRSILSDLLLIAGLFFGMLSIAFLTPWFSAFSVMLLVSSLLSRTLDVETLGGAGVAALPLFACLMFPLGYDTTLITSLQRVSAMYTGMLLDLIGLKHYIEGVTINMPGGHQYGIEEACSGVQSFFTLLFFALVFIVLNRRTTTNGMRAIGMSVIAFFVLITSVMFSISWLLLPVAIFIFLSGILGMRAALLIASAVFWAIFMNTLRILLIPLANYYFGFDLAHGIVHDLLGYSILGLGIVLLFSTDQFIMYMLGPNDADSSVASWLGNITGKKKKAKTRKPISPITRGLIWTVAVILGFTGIWQVVELRQSLANPNVSIRFFDADVTVPFEESDMPDVVEDWQKVDYEPSVRPRGSDLGMRSDFWQFRGPRCAAAVSFDQTFPGWHELTTCYKNGGWDLVSRNRVRPTDGNALQSVGDTGKFENSWPYVEATFKKNTGEYGYLLFSLFDSIGEPIDAPENWGTFNSFIIRAKNRLSHKVRANLFQSEAYQTQTFVQSYGDLNSATKNEVKQRFLTLREVMRSRYLAKSGVKNNSTEDTSNSTGDPIGYDPLDSGSSAPGTQSNSDVFDEGFLD